MYHFIVFYFMHIYIYYVLFDALQSNIEYTERRKAKLDEA